MTEIIEMNPLSLQRTKNRCLRMRGDNNSSVDNEEDDDHKSELKKADDITTFLPVAGKAHQETSSQARQGACSHINGIFLGINSSMIWMLCIFHMSECKLGVVENFIHSAYISRKFTASMEDYQH